MTEEQAKAALADADQETKASAEGAGEEISEEDLAGVSGGGGGRMKKFAEANDESNGYKRLYPNG